MNENIVFYHGTFHDNTMWDSWRNSHILSSYLTHAPTLYSPNKSIGTHTLTDYIHNAQEHIDSIDDAFTLIGWSMGATVAQHIAIDNPKVKSIHLISPTAPYGSLKGAWEGIKTSTNSPRWALQTVVAGLLRSNEGYTPSKQDVTKILFNKVSENEHD